MRSPRPSLQLSGSKERGCFPSKWKQDSCYFDRCWELSEKQEKKTEILLGLKWNMVRNGCLDQQPRRSSLELEDCCSRHSIALMRWKWYFMRNEQQPRGSIINSKTCVSELVARVMNYSWNPSYLNRDCDIHDSVKRKQNSVIYACVVFFSSVSC